MSEKTTTIAKQLTGAEQRLAQYKATVGFDGFIDTLVHPVKKTINESGKRQYFKTVAEFGRYLTSHNSVSCSIEMDVFSHKLGGNTPNLGNALSGLGAKVSCVGTFGRNAIDPVFSELDCDLYSFDDAGISTALEFNDGKILLAQNNTNRIPSWDDVTACTKEKKIEELIADADLLALVNWSELRYSHDLWEAALTHCLLPQKADKSKNVFFDLCDTTRKPDAEVLSALELIGRYAQRRKTVLSLNQNEAMKIGKVIAANGEMDQIAGRIRDTFGIEEIIVHTNEISFLLNTEGLVAHENSRVYEPKVLTGAGDNFNGAYCAALLLKLPPQDRLAFAAAFAEEFVRSGEAPSMGKMHALFAG